MAVPAGKDHRMMLNGMFWILCSGRCGTGHPKEICLPDMENGKLFMTNSGGIG